MNSRFALLALSITIVVLSLALFITVVGANASSATGVTNGIDADTATRDSTGNRLLPYQSRYFSQDETLSLTEPISIYLPLVEYEFVDTASERAALMALYNHTNGDGWINNTGWETHRTVAGMGSSVTRMS